MLLLEEAGTAHAPKHAHGQAQPNGASAAAPAAAAPLPAALQADAVKGQVALQHSIPKQATAGDQGVPGTAGLGMGRGRPMLAADMLPPPAHPPTHPPAGPALLPTDARPPAHPPTHLIHDFVACRGALCDGGQQDSQQSVVVLLQAAGGGGGGCRKCGAGRGG